MKLTDILARKPERIAPLETEEALRSAMAEPFAPGEEESYRRLMGVVADDLRLRQTTPQKAMWSWLPAVSVAAAAMILGVIAYDAGVHSGYNLAQTPPAIHSTPNAGSTKDAFVPHGYYEPKASLHAPQAEGSNSKPGPDKWRDGPDTGPSLAPILMDSLSADQKDLLQAADADSRNGDWKSAALHFEQLADADAKSSAAVGALDYAGAIYAVKLSDNAEATRIYHKEIQVCQDQIAATTDDAAKTHLQSLLDLARTNAGLKADGTTDAAAPAKN